MKRITKIKVHGLRPRDISVIPRHKTNAIYGLLPHLVWLNSLTDPIEQLAAMQVHWKQQGVSWWSKGSGGLKSMVGKAMFLFLLCDIALFTVSCLPPSFVYFLSSQSNVCFE